MLSDRSWPGAFQFSPEAIQMMLRILTLSVVLTTLNANQLPAQTSAEFGTCAYWQDQKPDPTKPDVSAIRRTYKVGLAHGFVLGASGGHLPVPEEGYSDPRWTALAKQYITGVLEAWQRPAFLVDAFDQKCGDYRNRGVGLGEVGLLVLLEVGGVSSQGIERALEILRAGGIPSRGRAFEALLRSQ